MKKPRIEVIITGPVFLLSEPLTPDFHDPHTETRCDFHEDFPEDFDEGNRAEPADWFWPDYLLAACIAMDSDGKWFAYEYTPTKGTRGWLPTSGRTCSLEFLDIQPPDVEPKDWRDSLVFNPNE